MTLLTYDLARKLYNEQGQQVVIPDTYTEIESSAFLGLDVTSISIPNSVTSIGNSAFFGNNLTSLSIPDSVTSIGAGAFQSNDLESVDIPDSVTSIGEAAFNMNYELTSIDIPNSVTSIGDYAFSATGIKQVILPDSFKTNPPVRAFDDYVNFTYRDGGSSSNTDLGSSEQVTGSAGSGGGNSDVVADNSAGVDSIENTIVNGRQYLNNGVDSLTGQKDFNLGLLDGDDFLEVVGGVNNFANGNNGSDNIVVRGGQGRYLGGADNDRLEVTG